MTVPASLSKWAHPPRSNTPRSSSSGPPGPCITPSTETCVVVVSFMVRPFSRVQVSGVTTLDLIRHSPFFIQDRRISARLFYKAVRQIVHSRCVNQTYSLHL